MKQIIHRIAAIIATLCIATFFTSTVIAELFCSHATIAMIKRFIVWPGLFILVPAIAVTGGTGFILSKERKGRLVKRKMKRMPFIGLNGLLILLPAAIFLDNLAASGSFDVKFYMVQIVELLAGIVNLSLMVFNIRDGLKMTGKLHSKMVRK